MKKIPFSFFLIPMVLFAYPCQDAVDSSSQHLKNVSKYIPSENTQMVKLHFQLAIEHMQRAKSLCGESDRATIAKKIEMIRIQQKRYLEVIK